MHYMSDRAAPARPWYDLIIETIAVKGWSKTTLSEKSGIARSTIDNWQRNSRAPQAPAVNAVADALGISRRRANELAGVITPARSALSPALLAAVRREVDPADQERVIAALEQAITGETPTEPGEAGASPGRRAAS